MDITKNLSWSGARDILKEYKDNNQRKSLEVVAIWENVLSTKIHKLGDERFAILEQVSIAALDCHDLDVASLCIGRLIGEFPNSLRVRTLVAMKREAEERYDEALELLETILKVDESNTTARKRKICILKAKNKIPEAIKEMTEYLKKFMTDQETWQELCDLYLYEGDYLKAAFCMEELFLHHPHNHLLHQKYADILYTQGGIENIELAKNHYLLSINLNNKNLRSLYGLALCCNYLITSTKYQQNKKKEINKRLIWVFKKIKNHYNEQNTIETGTGTGETGSSFNNEDNLVDLMTTLNVNTNAITNSS